MSTRCRIGLEMPNGKVKSVYCHFDGYPEGVGETLKKHYQNPEDVEKVLELGDLSSLGEFYNEGLAKKKWAMYEGETLTDEEKERLKVATIPYKDRGEKNVEARVDDNVYEFMRKIGNCGEDYTYLFAKDYTGVYTWQVCESPYFKDF